MLRLAANESRSQSDSSEKEPSTSDSEPLFPSISSSRAPDVIDPTSRGLEVSRVLVRDMNPEPAGSPPDPHMLLPVDHGLVFVDVHAIVLFVVRYAVSTLLPSVVGKLSHTILLCNSGLCREYYRQICTLGDFVSFDRCGWPSSPRATSYALSDRRISESARRGPRVERAAVSCRRSEVERQTSNVGSRMLDVECRMCNG